MTRTAMFVEVTSDGKLEICSFDRERTIRIKPDASFVEINERFRADNGGIVDITFTTKCMESDAPEVIREVCKAITGALMGKVSA